MAIRSKIATRDEIPPISNAKRPPRRVVPLPLSLQLPWLPRHDDLEETIDRLESIPEGQSRAKFFRSHSEAYCVDDTPELRMVLANVLLKGWDAWGKWDTEELGQFRSAFPELHRAMALQLIKRDCISELNGLVLGILLRPSTPSYVRARAESVIRTVDNNRDVLAFLASNYLAAEDEVVRQSLQRCIQPVSRGVGAYQRRSFWMGYLATPDGSLRAMAVVEIADAVSAIRTLTDGADMSPNVLEALERIAQGDPYEWARRQAIRKLRSLQSQGGFEVEDRHVPDTRDTPRH